MKNIRILKLLILMLTAPACIINANTCTELAFILAIPIVFLGANDENEAIATTTKTAAKMGCTVGACCRAYITSGAMWYGGRR